MTDQVPGGEERRLRQGLERLSRRAPRVFEPPPTMLRRARRRVGVTALAAAVLVSATVVGGVALSRSLAERPAPPSHHKTPTPTSTPTPTPAPLELCSFAPQDLPPLPSKLRRIVAANGNFQLASADGVTPDDIWLGGTVRGDFSKPAITTGVFLHWDGSAMTVLPPEDDVSVGPIAALAPDDAWSVTGTGAIHWDGSSWSTVGGTFANTLSVAGTAPDDMWAVGADFTVTAPSIEHFDGRRWSEVPTPESLHVPAGGPRTIALWDVAAVSPDDAWAVGGFEFQEGAGRAQPPVVLHWDGVRWAGVDVPTPEGRAYVGYGVAAVGPDDVWVAADAVVPDRDATPGVLLHWDGSTWSDAPLVAPPGTSLHLQAVDSTGPDDVWAAGSAFAAGTERSIPVIEHFDGTAWTEVPLGGSEPDGEGRIRSIRVIGGEVWAVGFTALDQPPFVSVCRTRGSPGA